MTKILGPVHDLLGEPSVALRSCKGRPLQECRDPRRWGNKMATYIKANVGLAGQQGESARRPNKGEVCSDSAGGLLDDRP